ncbi:MAG: ATP-binding cassette domain-containing protein, partial [Planctomycetota bacterium]
KLLAEALEKFAGVGLLVSHDRELMDRLCRQTLFVEPPGATLRPGGYTKAVELADSEQHAARQEKAKASTELKRLKAEAVQRRQEASASHRKRSKRGIPTKDHDAKSRIDLARVSGKDGQAGRLLKQMQGRVAQARGRLAGIRTRKDRRLGVKVPGEQSKRDVLVRLPPGKLPLGKSRALTFPELLIRPHDRIALVGPNGSGKSTLVEHIVSRLGLPTGRYVYLSQEIDTATARKVIEDARRLPTSRLGEVMGIVSQLGSEPGRLLETELPSPGELRKLMLALGMAHRPWLIVMDEPTNHLDLPSIECVESALADCPAALLLVSHDRRFLKALTRTCWRIWTVAGSDETHLDICDGPDAMQTE